MKHTILGAGGSIGIPLAKELIKKGEEVRLVSRSSYSMKGAESVQADLFSAKETIESVAGSDVVYLLAGLPYDAAVWKERWPQVMKNSMEAAGLAGARLIFFDNVYMYGKVEGPMTEDTPYNPCSKKGEVRADIARMLEDAMGKNGFSATIARAADLYGPWITRNSMLYILALDKMLKGKKPQWLIADDLMHSFTYTLDCARALVLMAHDGDTANQVFHLPTYNPAPTGKEYIKIMADILGLPASHSVMGKGMLRLGGVFDPTVREVSEMSYQSEFSYWFDSTKFNKYFSFQPVTYEDGLRETIDFYRG